MGREEDIMHWVSKSIAEEIDFEILSTMLVDECGWTRVVIFDIQRPVKQATNVNTWLHTECVKHWKHLGATWIFEDQNEAALFRLTWM